MIDLRSDTVTRPTEAMLTAMLAAKVGDDVFAEDPTVIALERQGAELFGMEAGLFCPSGTMTNQIAIKVHTQPGDEVICDRLSHVYSYEGGGIAFNSGCSVRLLNGDRGRFTAAEVEENINVDDVHFPKTRLVCIENTCNKGGGSTWELTEINNIRQVCLKHGLDLHLDGARVFNALEAKMQSPGDFREIFDSISICLSKGLGAPVGSLLLGSKDFIRQARRVRKVFGGGMRQAGFMAAAGIYALENHIGRLSQDHMRAQALEEVLDKQPYVKNILPVDTNIIAFTLTEDRTAADFLDKLKEQDILAVPLGKQSVRFVTHLDFGDSALEQVTTVLKRL